MQLVVRYFAAARDAAGVADDIISIDDGATIATLRDTLARRRPSLAVVLVRCRIAVDHVFVGDDAVIVGREIALIPPVAGG